MFLTYFFVNVLCAITSCPPNFGAPGENAQTPIIRNRLLRRLVNQSDFDLAAKVTDRPEPFVRISDGSLQGYFMKTISGREIYAFEGIPFALAPVGERRFRPPVPVKPWSGILSATESAPYCLQMHAFFLNRIFGTEDCLKLNVYTPKLPEPVDGNRSTAKLPVIVFIHGGSFQFGSAKEYGPAYLLEQDVILVTINYRVGILGFLSTGDAASPGNNGLKDQAMAIEWVHENIEKFGGDPNSVTLGGESAGGVSVHLHMLSKRNTKDYFQKAIAMSGTAFNFWSISSRRMARKWTTMAAKMARCPTSNSTQIMECLRARNPNYLVSYQFNMQDYFPSYPSVMFGPVIEDEGPDAIVTEKPEDVYARDGAPAIPMIVSTTSAEGEVAIIGLPAVFRFTPFRTQWDKYGPIFLGYNHLEGANVNRITKSVEEHYFLNGTTSRTAPLRVFSDMTTERFFAPGIYKTLQTHSKIAPTYSSVFAYRGRFGIARGFGLERGDFRVGHVEDMFYIFNMTQFSQGLKLTDPEYEPAKFMVNAWTQFMKTGIPAIGNTTDLWPMIQPSNVQQVVVDNQVVIAPYPKNLKQGISFWESVNATESLP